MSRQERRSLIASLWRRRSRICAGLLRRRSARIRRGGFVSIRGAGRRRVCLPGFARLSRMALSQYFTGAMTLRGWPVQITDAAFSSEGGEAKIPGISSPVRIGAIAGGRSRDTLTIEPFRVAYASPSVGRADSAAASTTGAGAAAGKKRAGGGARGIVNVGFTHDFVQRAGHISV